MQSLEQKLAELGKKFDRHAVEILEKEWKSKAAEFAGRWRPAPPNANAAWLEARLEATAGRFREAALAWENFFRLDSARDPSDLLAYARACLESARPGDACSALRRALAQRPGYTFFARAEKTVDRIPADAISPLRRTRIAILGTSTTATLVPLLRALCLRDRIHAEIYQGLYGAMEQEVLDPQSGLNRFRPEIVFLAAHWRDLHLEALSADPEKTIADAVARWRALWSHLAERFPCHVVQYAFDQPAENAYGYLSTSLPGGRRRVIEAINAKMRAELPAHVSLLDTGALQYEVGAEVWEDPGQWHHYKQHPSTQALPALAEVQMAHVRAVLGLTRKVLITDLDNTLWQGVIGEDGVNGIRIGPGTPAGEAFESLQRYMLELKSRGVVLAVCSKNNLSDARLPFMERAEMALRLDDFAAFEANWSDKVSNLRSIAAKLSLGLDSFVFLDDNPVEREWVRSQLPDVAVVELGTNPADYVRDLDRGRYFFSLTLSAEDISRADSYRVEQSRENLRTSTGSIAEFLAELQIQAAAEPVSQKNLSRVAQLTNKTNQFNLTTRRYTEAQIQQIANNGGGWARAFHLSDRFGSYGLIGLLFCVDRGSRQWEIDTWLMSCRALGRQAEEFMFDCLMQAAAESGIRQITGVYRATPKNGLVADLYDRFGFRKESESADEIRYVIDVGDKIAPRATHIRDVTLSASSTVIA